MNVHNLLLLAALVTFPAVPAVADMCKWVDESGTVHYALSCPEGVEGTIVRTAPPPSQEELERAIKRSEEMLQQRRELAGIGEQDKTSSTGVMSGERQLVSAANGQCETAFAEREILKLDLPIYRDETGQLHHRDSLHHHWYEGRRTYLEDDQRTSALLAVERLIKQKCANVQPAKNSYVYRYLDKPTLTEMLFLLDDMLTFEGPSISDTCPYARLMLSDLQAAKHGIPSDDEREFEQRVSERCQ